MDGALISEAEHKSETSSEFTRQSPQAFLTRMPASLTAKHLRSLRSYSGKQFTDLPMQSRCVRVPMSTHLPAPEGWRVPVEHCRHVVHSGYCHGNAFTHKRLWKLRISLDSQRSTRYSYTGSSLRISRSLGGKKHQDSWLLGGTKKSHPPRQCTGPPRKKRDRGGT